MNIDVNGLFRNMDICSLKYCFVKKKNTGYIIFFRLSSCHSENVVTMKFFLRKTKVNYLYYTGLIRSMKYMLGTHGHMNFTTDL